VVVVMLTLLPLFLKTVNIAEILVFYKQFKGKFELYKRTINFNTFSFTTFNLFLSTYITLYCIMANFGNNVNFTYKNKNSRAI